MAKLGQRQSPECGTGTLAHEMRKFNYYRRQFFRILGDTQKALKDVAHMKIFPLESTISDAVRTSQENALRPPAIVILGTARARLVNFLLGEKLLPPQSNISSCTNGWRWLRLQHGNRRQVRLNLGSDIEILEPNLTIDSNGDQISPQTLKRNDNLDLSTVMDIELCNPFLKNGVQILVPPDLGDLALDNKSPYEYTHESIIKDYETFFSKRGSFLENVFPIILYALDEIEPLENANNVTKQSNTSCGKEPKKNIYTLPNFTITSPKISPQLNPNNSKQSDKSKSKFYIDINDKSSSDSDESTSIAFNMQNNDEKDSIFSRDEKNMPNIENLPGLSEENLLDLRQIFELHPNAQVLFVLFSNDSQEEKSANESSEFSTESFISNSNKNYGQPSTSYEQIFHFDSITPSSTTFEPHSMFPISSISPNINSVSSFADATIPKDMKFDNFDDTNESSFNCDKNISELKENGSSHLDKQKAFLIRLVEQLELMSNPLMKSSFTGHWLIVDDANINSKHICEKSPNSNKTTKKQIVDNDVILNREDFIYNFVTFTRGCLQNYMLHDCNKLSEIHNTLLQQFILTSFDMAREMQIIPRKIQYVSEMEQQLFDTLNEKFTGGEKREELLEMMNYVLQDMKNNISNINLAGKDSPCHGSSECINLTMPNSIFYPEVLIENPINVEETHVHNKNDKSDSKSNPTNDLKNNTKSISLDLNEYCIIKTPPKENTATKGVDALEDNSLQIDDSNLPTVKDKPDSETSPTNDNENGVEFRKKNLTDPSCRANLSRNSSSSFKQASLEVQRTVLAKLSRNISIQLVKFVDCLRDSYFGTLQRCLDSLEEGRGRRIASEAVRQILLVTRTVDLQHCASFSFLHALVDQLRRFFSRLSLSSGNDRSCCIQSPRWRRQVALDTIESLSATRLAKIISTQLRDRIRLSHEQFQSALQSLGEHHSTRLQETEELKLALRKLHAPRFARLCLESTSLGDLARYGVPRLGREIGRGQYGVVYSVKGFWGGYEPCAVKSVVPPDERHFNELAMEFFHTRNIPEHDRIVRLRGSVIDYSYEGCSPAVLLVSERLRWDLHCALLHANLSFVQRMQIAVDIVEGIRYLHSQGLVHRDIKLKNVLLDESNRAKLTDLGFCIPEAMMSGSIVGTPVHMAPELLSGIYDNSVDVYAFGILFWYVCAGHVKLPTVFEHFQNKEQLWCNVKKGLRPERLPQFSDVCWSLMEKCWAAEPLQRPLLGDVQPILEKTRDQPNFDTNIP